MRPAPPGIPRRTGHRSPRRPSARRQGRPDRHSPEMSRHRARSGKKPTGCCRSGSPGVAPKMASMRIRPKREAGSAEGTAAAPATGFVRAASSRGVWPPASDRPIGSGERRTRAAQRGYGLVGSIPDQVIVPENAEGPADAARCRRAGRDRAPRPVPNHRQDALSSRPTFPDAPQYRSASGLSKDSIPRQRFSFWPGSLSSPLRPIGAERGR